jgi:DNA polymerase III delta prime subunit
VSLEAPLQLAREGRLYPAVILHGGTREARLAAGVTLSRALLCGAAPAKRPCGGCRHCRRIGLVQEGKGDKFHPDFRALARDLRTATSVEATKEMLRLAQLSPFEGRGQVFLLLDAETLTDSAANALLKTLEEPHTSAPRHFLMLAPAATDLLPTLRSRALAIYLGRDDPLAAETLDEMRRDLSESVRRLVETASPIYLLQIAAVLERQGGFEDLRSSRPFCLAARAVVDVSGGTVVTAELRPRLLALADDLLRAPEMRLRAIPPQRILEGLVCRHLGGI